MRYISLYLFRFPIFILVFVLCGIMQFVPPLHADTGVSTPLFSDTESLFADVHSCDENVDETDEGVVEEKLAEIPGTTMLFQ